MEIRKGEAYQREKMKTERMVKYEHLNIKPVFKSKPTSEGTEYATSQQVLEGAERGGEVHHSKQDKELLEELQYEADVGDTEGEEQQDLSGTSWDKPGYRQGGAKRKREEEQ